MANSYDLTPEAVDLFEVQKVPAIFRPLAAATLDRVPIAPGGSVLDLACGTGVLSRLVRERYGPGVAVTGLDLSTAMIAKARALAAGMPGEFTWHVSDAATVPAPAGAFTHCFCQQGVQYFPDRAAVFAELMRVLGPGGRVALTTWAPANAFFLAKAEALERHVGREIAEKSLSPFSYRGEEEVPRLLAEAGFLNVGVTAISIERVIPDAATGIAEDTDGSPLGPPVRAAGPGVMERIVEETLEACASYIEGDTLVIAQHGFLMTGSRP